MSKVIAGHFSELADALESAAAAVRKIEGAYENAGTKSADVAANAGAGKPAKPVGKAAPAAVAAKPAKGGKPKTPDITFDDVKAKLSELMEAQGQQVVKELLSEYGVAKLKDLEEDSYAECHAKAVEKLAEDTSEPVAEDDDMFGDT